MTTDVVIIGAGIAGITTATALRTADFTGGITIFGQETTRPYDRPPLSKNGLTDEPFAPAYLLSTAQQTENNIDLQLGQVVTAIDRDTRTISLRSGRKVPYRSLVIATGATARPLSIDGGHHALLLRSDADARRIRDALSSTSRLVVIGGGFIGLEVAASARSLGSSVTVIEAGSRLMTRGVPAEIAAVAATAHHDRGINICLNAIPKSIIAKEDATFTVTLADGQQHPADLVVAGVGALPNTALAESASLVVANGIAVDQYLRTSDPSIFAIGDCSSYLHNGERLRLEAWRNAVDQANTVAQVITGNGAPFQVVPWFWSDQHDLGLQITGLPHTAVSSVVRTRDDGAVVWFGLDQHGVLVSAAAIGLGTGIAKDIRLAERLITANASPPPQQLADPTSDFKQLVKQLLANEATP